MNLHNLIANRVNLHRSGNRQSGPCPKCAGNDKSDKFSLYPDDTFHCFACGFHGDIITWLREMEGQGCADAHTTAGRTCHKADCPQYESCRHGVGTKSKQRKELQPKTEKAESPFRPATPNTPQQNWSNKASDLIEVANQALLNNQEQLQYLQNRGINLQAVEQYRLGWIEKDLFRARSAWGLPEETSQKTSKPKKLWIPAGILIPFFDQTGNPFRIRIRRHTVEEGSGNDVPVLNPERRAFIVIESDLDGIACAAATNQAGAVPLGTCSAKPKEAASKILQGALAILVSLDGDKAGATAAKWWKENYPRATRWPVPQGKDPGDYVKDHHGDLGTWIKAGLSFACPAFNIETPVQQEVKAEPTAKPQLPEHLFGTSINGHEFVVAYQGSDIEQLKIAYPGVPVFSPKEIAALKGISKEAAEKALLIKKEFSAIIRHTEHTIQEA